MFTPFQTRLVGALANDWSTDVDEAAESFVNTRPSSKSFGCYHEREAAHAAIYNEGIAANSAGDLDVACDCFLKAYALLFRRAPLLSFVNMKLKMGEAELAVACYVKVLESGALTSQVERDLVTSKLQEARQLRNAVRDIVQAPQSALLNSTAEREHQHRQLVERAKAANEQKQHAQAASLFQEAWPLLYRPSTLISMANMLLHGDAHRLRVAIGVYSSLLGLSTSSPLTSAAPVPTAEEVAVIERKLREARRTAHKSWHAMRT